MANLQYIGARYVPKFYENPDTGDSEWKSGVPYEPLTVVTYNGDSYTSKIPVAGTVGDPATNPTYWAKTADYSAAINGLQTRVGNIENQLADYDEKVDFSFGDITFKRHHLSGYCIDVIKIPYINTNDGSKNVPIIRGDSNRKPIAEFDNGTMAAIGGVGFFRTTSPYEFCNDMLLNDVVVQGITGQYNNSPYLAIDEDGHFDIFPLGTDLSTLPPMGYHYAAQCRCRFIENGVFTPYAHNPQVVQQNIGVDYDNNYYLITTSYYLPLTYQTLADWILLNIPNIKDVYALDGGGSTQTTVGRVRTNLESDFDYDNGRPVPAAIVFPCQNSGNIETLGEIVKQSQIIAKTDVLHYVKSAGLNMQNISTNIQMGQFNLFQNGNVVYFHAIIRIHDGYSVGTWESVTIPDLPPSTGQVAFTMHPSYTSGHDAAKFQVYTQADEWTTDGTAAIRSNEAPPSGDFIEYEVTGFYLTRRAT